jgi:DNA-binding transcriptional ArsR family regulator
MESKGAVAALAALAQETRLQIFRLLVRSMPQGLAAGAIAERLQIRAATLSFHLNQLRQAGLVRRRRQSRSIIYAAETKRMRALMSFLARDCCEGRPELCGISLDNRASCARPAPPTARRATLRGAR